MWLYLANAYGSILQKLIKHSENIPYQVQQVDLILDYYNFYIKTILIDVSSDRQCLERDVITACTISVIQFTNVLTC